MHRVFKFVYSMVPVSTITVTTTEVNTSSSTAQRLSLLNEWANSILEEQHQRSHSVNSSRIELIQEGGAVDVVEDRFGTDSNDVFSNNGESTLHDNTGWDLVIQRMDTNLQEIQGASQRLGEISHNIQEVTVWDSVFGFFFSGTAGILTAAVTIGGVTYFIAKRLNPELFTSVRDFIRNNFFATSSTGAVVGAMSYGPLLRLYTEIIRQLETNRYRIVNRIIGAARSVLMNVTHPKNVKKKSRKDDQDDSGNPFV